jgi:hypothetical protein
MGLKVEPICRSACVERLNLLREKSDPPIIARIWPVALSIASSAPSTTGSWSRSPVANAVASSSFVSRTWTRSPSRRKSGFTFLVHA